jgi:ATP-binding cassette subfamily C protein
MSAGALLEAFSALAVVGLLRLVVEPGRVRSAPVVSEIWQAWPTDDPAAVVAALVGAVAVLYVVRALFVTWAEWVKETTIARSASRAAERLFARYLAADYTFHLGRQSSQLIQEVARSTDVAFQLFAGSLLNIVAEAATVAALVTVLFLTAPPQALGAVALVLGIASLPMLLTRRLWVRAGERQRSLEAQQLHVLQQSLGAVKEVKITGREAFFEGRLRATRRALARVNQRRALMATALRLAVETVLIISMLGVVLLVMRERTTDAELVAVLALFAYTGFRLVPSANRIMLNAGYVREARAFVTGGIRDFSMVASAPSKAPASPEARVEFTRSLACEDVSYTYDGASQPALHHINLTIRPGESLGIVGETGAGKSTLVDVLLGLLRPTTGRVSLDGEGLEGRERSWQRQVGYVPQRPYLLAETIRRNIAFGLPDMSIDEHGVARAATLAHLDDVIRQLPQGLDTVIGENGAGLSGGQQQRVAIARALYADPAVLVFDEATAALDTATEREVTAALSSLHGTRTLIVIAHRLSTVRECDRLLFLQRGRIAASGSYNELMGNPAFRAMTTP